jgi:hypothetical protein
MTKNCEIKQGEAYRGKRGIRKKSDAKPETIFQRHFYEMKIVPSIYRSIALVADSNFLMQKCKKYNILRFRKITLKTSFYHKGNSRITLIFRFFE